MATRNKFEEMLERLINEDREGAEELFHEIVVAKSRDIYESLLEADLDDEEVDEASDEEVEESEDEDEDDDELDENFNLDEFEVEADPMDMDVDMGGDPTDDMMGDMEPSDDDGMDMGGDDEDLDDRVEDLEDALNDLKAEFEKMMAGDDSDDEGEDDMDMDMGGDEEDDDDEEMESFEDDVDEAYKKKSKKSAGEEMREYVEKVNGGFGANIGGDNGANAKSTVAGKNDMGGTTANLRGGESKSEGTQGGLAAPTPKDMNTKNVNVPGAKGATKMASQPGHGAEKKSKPETADKGAGSPLNGAPKRAK